MRSVDRLSVQRLRSLVLDDRLPAPGSITIGLVGRGITSSLSPLMHEQEGRRLGLNYRYHLIDFDRLELDDAQLGEVVAEARDLGFAGLNVTYPFKQAILPLLSKLDPDAEAIGAVNTVVLTANGSVGYNTDCWGFAESFRRGLPGIARCRVLQLGSGGAGAAVARALLQSGVEQLDIFDMDRAKSEALAQRLRQLLGAKAQAVSDLATARLADGIVNTTPVGMAKHPGLPLNGDLVGRGQWVADVIYFPLETALLHLARDRGCKILSGGGMAVFQAVRAFELFSGIVPDPDAMAATFRKAVEG